MSLNRWPFYVCRCRRWVTDTDGTSIQLHHLGPLFECKIPPNFALVRIGRGLSAFIQMADGGGPLVAQMLEQDIAKLAAGTAAERVQDGLVFAHRFPPTVSLPGKIGRITHPANSSGEVRVKTQQRRAA